MRIRKRNVRPCLGLDFRFWWIAFGVREFLVRAGQR